MFIYYICISALNPVTGESGLVSASTGTWEGKLPPSLTDDIPLSSSTHITSPSKSPHKRPLEESPSKVNSSSLSSNALHSVSMFTHCHCKLGVFEDG